MLMPVRIYMSLFEQNWRQLLGSKISKDWENVPENGSFATYFMHCNQKRSCKGLHENHWWLGKTGEREAGKSLKLEKR